jgi:hypothetical protein
MTFIRPFDLSVREPLAACLQIAKDSQRVPEYLRITCVRAQASSFLLGSREYSKALPLLLESVQAGRVPPVAPRLLSADLELLGLAYRFLGKYREDELASRESFELTIKNEGEQTLRSANLRAVWATSLAGIGDTEKGLREAEAALATYRGIYPRRAALLMYSPLSAATANSCLSGKYAKCAGYAKEALDSLGPNPAAEDARVFGLKGYLGLALANLGMQKNDSRLMAEAKPLLQASLQWLRNQNRTPIYRKPIEDTLAKLP